MDAIIGLGAAGVSVAEAFSKYPQYKIFKIDSGVEEADGLYSLKQCKTSEEYESSCPDMSEYFSELDEEANVIFVIGGGGKIAGASLRILEQLKHTNLNVLYVTPDLSMMGGKGYFLNRISYHVLQEYARSGMFNSIALLYNPSVEDVIGDVPVRGYFETLNETIASTIHMINVFKNTEAVMKNIGEREEHHRIFSYGVVHPETSEEKMFFPLDNIREKVYYIGINKSALDDGAYFKKLKKAMRERAEQEDVKISFQINETKYDNPYAYFVAYSDEIQQENNLKKYLTKSEE